MKNALAISSLSRRMSKVCEQIEELAMDVQENEQGIGELAEMYKDMLMDELEHVQMLTLKLTDMISLATVEGAANTDEGEGSVFASGDLKDGKAGDGGGEEESK